MGNVTNWGKKVFHNISVEIGYAKLFYELYHGFANLGTIKAAVF
jgi:hypothetical protein